MAKTEILQLRKRFTALLVMAAVLVTSVVSVAAYSRTAIIKDGQKELKILTTNINTDYILDSANITLGENDEIVRSDDNGNIVINVLRAFAVTVNNHAENLTVQIAKGTVADAISKAGITLQENDVATPDLTTEVSAGMEISIKSKLNIKVTADGETKEYSVLEGSVYDALHSTDLTIGDDDIISAKWDEQVTDGMEITLQRVTYKEVTANEKIDYDTVKKETSSLYSGETKVETDGVKGEKQVTKREMYVDGKLTETKVLSSKVIKEPVDKVVNVGTKEKSSFSGSSVSSSNAAGAFTDSNGNKIYYSSKIVGTATAYSAAEGALTATGVPVYYGGVAVDPSIIPYGSKLYIVSNDGAYVYGYATAVDTGGAMLSGQALVDLFYPSESQCYAFGRRNVTIYVL